MAVFLKHAHSQQCQRLFFLKGTFKHCPSLWGSQLIGLIHVRVDKHALINFWYGHYLKSKITITKQVERLGECFAETMLYAVTQLRVSYFHTDCNQECFFFFFLCSLPERWTKCVSEDECTEVAVHCHIWQHHWIAAVCFFNLFWTLDLCTCVKLLYIFCIRVSHIE